MPRDVGLEPIQKAVGTFRKERALRLEIDHRLERFAEEVVLLHVVLGEHLQHHVLRVQELLEFGFLGFAGQMLKRHLLQLREEVVEHRLEVLLGGNACGLRKRALPPPQVLGGPDPFLAHEHVVVLVHAQVLVKVAAPRLRGLGAEPLLRLDRLEERQAHLRAQRFCFLPAQRKVERVQQVHFGGDEDDDGNHHDEDGPGIQLVS
mmetsp:Transcript_2716/g.4565  ORF Transcript_2716/g.4565 Transcript_2716/m.4565 type:complete len:205 (+) Transcript_2716:182-796(+)